MWHAYQGTPLDNRQAENWLRRSIELDPTLARGHSILARVLAARCWYGNSDDIERDLSAARVAAERAVSLDERDAAAHYAVSIIELMLHTHERALRAARRAIDVNLNYAQGYFALGETRLFMGQFTEALDPLMHCLRLSPYDPSASVFLSLIALAKYHLCNFTEAAEYCERALQKRRTYVVLRSWAATLGQLGRTEEAWAVLAEMEQLKPANAERHWKLTCPYADPAHEVHLLEGLRKARCQEVEHSPSNVVSIFRKSLLWVLVVRKRWTDRAIAPPAAASCFRSTPRSGLVRRSGQLSAVCHLLP